MKKLLSLSFVILAACGYSSQGNDMIGQVKKVIERTPVLCPDYTEVDLSLGVMRNGVGSMSHEDMVLYVENEASVQTLKRAATDGTPVHVTYATKRLSICVPTARITSVELVP